MASRSVKAFSFTVKIKCQTSVNQNGLVLVKLDCARAEIPAGALEITPQRSLFFSQHAQLKFAGSSAPRSHSGIQMEQRALTSWLLLLEQNTSPVTEAGAERAECRQLAGLILVTFTRGPWARTVTWSHLTAVQLVDVEIEMECVVGINVFVVGAEEKPCKYLVEKTFVNYKLSAVTRQKTSVD